MLNPLRLVLTEARQNACEPPDALLRLMIALQMSFEPTCILLACVWHDQHGEPTYEALEKWADEFAADPANAAHMELMVRHHHECLMADPELAAVAAQLRQQTEEP
jgi:hypothetical protein